MKLNTALSVILSTKREYLRALDEIGIRTPKNLLLYFPRTYEDLSQLKKLSEVKKGENVTLKGQITGLKQVPIKKRGLRLLKAVFSDEAGMPAELIWFNQPHLTRTLAQNTDVMIAGKVDIQRGGYVIQNPEVEPVGQFQVHTAGLIPIYPEHGVITSKWLRNKIHPMLDSAAEFPEILPDQILKEEKLIGKAEAVREIHFPSSSEALKRARDRLAYEELFLLQLHAVRLKNEWKKSREKGSKLRGIKMNVELVKQFFSTLPFTPTNAQRIAIFEILRDMEKPYPMMRLLEGDVGSGKTLVAATAILQAVKAGYQAAFMAPTEVLARQHLISLAKLLRSYNLRIDFLSGSLEPKEKKAIQKAVKEGKTNIVVGTHALIQESVAFSRLGLAVIDEQHRFGVCQREALMRHGSPHVLNMTATPIPRTLAIVAYGDQDLSVLNEMPPGRQIVITKVVPPEHRKTIYQFIAGKMSHRQQVFVICPLIDESDTLEIKSVKTEFERLKNIFPQFSLAMLHGKMKPEAKEKAMADFKEGKTDLLVSTSVIEVGIDVPNAVIMLIEGADRFGLSQLHQFRGRVGRGMEQSYCFLFTDSEAPATFQRLKAMADYTDGFKLAEIDLKLRGPGEVYGIRQSGMPNIKIANFSNPVLVSRVRKAAELVAESSPDLKRFPGLLAALAELETKNEIDAS